MSVWYFAPKILNKLSYTPSSFQFIRIFIPYLPITSSYSFPDDKFLCILPNPAQNSLSPWEFQIFFLDSGFSSCRTLNITKNINMKFDPDFFFTRNRFSIHISITSTWMTYLILRNASLNGWQYWVNEIRCILSL